MAPRYLGSAAAAAYIGFEPGKKGANAVRQLVHRRQIPFSKIGKMLRFDVKALDAWLAESAVKAQQSV